MLSRYIDSIKTMVSWQIRKLFSFCGIDLSLDTDDRRVLETVIFPYFARRDEFHRILFVGCDWYTRGYNKVFMNKEYWTIEVDPRRSKYGAERHIVDSVENVNLHFSKNDLDLIICNGVFGWGLNARADVERAFQGFFDCLREGGVLVHGWNDIPAFCPFPLEECHSLSLFSGYVFPPLSTSNYLTANPNRHIYDFYVKPSLAHGAGHVSSPGPPSQTSEAERFQRHASPASRPPPRRRPA